MRDDIKRDDRCLKAISDIYLRLPEQIETSDILAAMTDAYYAGIANARAEFSWSHLTKPKFGDDR